MNLSGVSPLYDDVCRAWYRTATSRSFSKYGYKMHRAFTTLHKLLIYQATTIKPRIPLSSITTLKVCKHEAQSLPQRSCHREHHDWSHTRNSCGERRPSGKALRFNRWYVLLASLKFLPLVPNILRKVLLRPR